MKRWLLGLCPPRIDLADGYIRLSSAPGFGVDLDEQAIAENQLIVKQGGYKAPPWDAGIFTPT